MSDIIKLIKLFKHTILYVAAFLLLLHSITPHHHHGELSAVEHEREHRSNDLFDVLRTIFHTDFGDSHHLQTITIAKTGLQSSKKTIQQQPSLPNPEVYKITQYNSDLAALATAPFICEPIHKNSVFIHCRCACQWQHEHSVLHFSTNSLRGPPLAV